MSPTGLSASSQMVVSVTLPLSSIWVTDLGGEGLSAGFVVANSGEGCLITRGTLS